MIIYKTWFYSYGNICYKAYFKTMRGVINHHKECEPNHNSDCFNFGWRMEEITVGE